MATKLRQKCQDASPKAGNKSQKKTVPSKLVPRVEKPWDGIAYTLEVTQEHKVRVSDGEPSTLLGTIDPSTQTHGRIYYLTSRYWSILNPYSFQKQTHFEGDDGQGYYYDITLPVTEENSHRIEVANAGLADMGHPLNISNVFQRDEEGNLTNRRAEHGVYQWGPVYPAIKNHTVMVPITKKLRINLPEQVVQEFRRLAQSRVEGPRKRGRQKTVLLDEAITLLARWKVPVTYQAVQTMLAEVNDKPVNVRTIQLAMSRLGLERRGTIEGFATGYYGYPGDMVDRRPITIGHERIQGSGCPLAGVDAREVLRTARRRRPDKADRSWMPLVKLEARQKKRVRPART